MGKNSVLKKDGGNKSLLNKDDSGLGLFQRFVFFIRGVQIVYALIFFVTVLILTFTAASFAFAEDKFEKIPTCGDGTFYNKCSLDKPYYCQDGILIEKSSTCGCDEGMRKSGDSCSSEYGSEREDIVLTYFLEGSDRTVNFPLYKGVEDYVLGLSRIISYEGSEVPSRADFKIKSINEGVQREMILPLVKEIQNLAPTDKVDQARIAISIVQNIPYGHSNRTLFFGGKETNYSRYPYEVLYDSKGICGEKSALMAFLLKELGYGTAIFYFEEENHEAIGIKCPVEKSLYGSGFCFVETGGPSIISDISLEFSDGIRLDSTPEVILISEGISLPKGLDEYRDAKNLKDIRKRNIFGVLKFWKEDNIVEKYNLDSVYNIK
ncbi:MAG: hypothetical protein Q8P81_01020 [Nanoarchaeota archaeon]|nr:hypothetical protein [Nanoarchaeota archaeon]